MATLKRIIYSKWLNNTLSDSAALIGILSLGYGIWLLSIPLAFIFVGLLFCGLAWGIAHRE